MAKTIFIFIFILNAIATNGQELVNIKFTDNDGIFYNGLLIKYTSTDISFRCSFTVNGKKYLTYLEMISEPSGTFKDGSKYQVLRQDASLNEKEGAIDFYYVFLSKDVFRSYKIPSFIWYPESKITPDDDRPYFSYDTRMMTKTKRVDSCMVIDPHEVTEDFLLQFFDEDDEDLEEIKTMCGLKSENQRILPPLKFKPTMHFIMVVNKDDKKIGLSCSKDEEKLNKELSAICRTLGIFYKTYFIYCANDLTRSKLQNKLDEVSPSKEDIVIFSYSGHGCRWNEQKDGYPFMNLWVTPQFTMEPKDQAEFETVKQIIYQNSLGISDVFTQITSKGARLNIVLGDLCNTSIGVPRPVNTETYLSFDGHRGLTDFFIRDTLQLRKLFIEAKGNLLSTAAKPDETASGNISEGGYFTTAFIECLREAESFRAKKLNWEAIIDKTLKIALAYRKKANPAQVQSGLRFIKLAQ